MVVSWFLCNLVFYYLEMCYNDKTILSYLLSCILYPILQISSIPPILSNTIQIQKYKLNKSKFKKEI